MPGLWSAVGMRILHWLRPPRHLLVIFLGTTFAFLGTIGWLGWRSLQLDSAVEAQRVRDQLDNSTDLVAADIRQTLTDIDGELARLSVVRDDSLNDAALAFSQGLGEDGLVVVFEPVGVRAFPSQRLLYRPALDVSEDPDLQVFAIGEAYETRGRDFDRAALYFQDLAESDDQQIRAGALLRLARNQRKAGRTEAALATYRRLEGLPVAIDGRPVELLARTARAAMFDDLRRTSLLGEEARRLAADLHNGRWPLTQAAYRYYSDEVRQWLVRAGAESAAGPSADAVSLASAVDTLWERWRQDRRAPEMLAGRTSMPSNGRSVFLFWRSTGDRLVALVGGPPFLSGRVVEPLRAVLERQQVGVVLADGEGRTVVSYAIPSTPAVNVVRTMADTRLPWTLRVVSASGGADAGQLAARRRLLLAGLGFLAMLVVAGSYFSARALTRESEAARLQSEFVAAVSHEFRTPLTLLRQFSDLLAEGRVSNESERRRYYAALQRGTRRLTRLVEDLLDFGRMEAGSHGFRLEPVVARAAIERVADEFQEEVRGQGYQVEFEWHAPDRLIMRADEAAIGRALWNLLDNAAKYSPTCKTIWVSGSFDGESLMVCVRDRGLGVREDERRAIFRKFVRGSTPDGHFVKGTGLGLTLVAQIVEGHGGTVGLDSIVDEGSTFTISLPAHVEPAQAMVS